MLILKAKNWNQVTILPGNHEDYGYQEELDEAFREGASEEGSLITEIYQKYIIEPSDSDLLDLCEGIPVDGITQELGKDYTKTTAVIERDAAPHRDSGGSQQQYMQCYGRVGGRP